jgi:phospholipase D1/2
MNEFASEPTSSETLLHEGQTCWKNTIAERATLLVDGEEYYRTLRDALLKAQRQILIAGWDFDTRAQLPRDPASRDRMDATAPTELGEFLGFLLRRRPELEIHVLRWDYHWFYGDDREWNTRERLQKHGVHFHEHPARLITGCVHHKIVVIDDVLGFCGGIDLTHKRWDTCLHEPDEARRCDPCGKSYKPVHDTQLCVSGPAAAWLGEYVRRHWPETASVPAPAPVSDAAAIWPNGLHVDFANIRTGIARTLPDVSEAASSREIEAFYLAAIAATKHTLYIENQYFTSERIAEGIATQFRREPKLEGLLVGLDQPETPAEYHTMGYGRARFCNILGEKGVTARIPLVAALCGDGRAINVHSKIAVFDDRWLMVGSANLNRRSMGFDLECNLVLEASTSAHRARIVQLRNGLLGEHVGLELDEVAAALKMHGLARLPEAVRGSRRLVRVDPQQSELNLGPILAPVFDREENWPAVTPPTLRIEQLQGVLLLAVAVTAVAFTSRVVAEDLPTLNSLQRFVTQLLNG